MASVVAVALVVGSVVVSSRPPNGDATGGYHVLSDRSVDEGTADEIHVVFDPALSPALREQVLASVGGRLVDGPNSAGAWTARLAGPRSPAQLAGTLDELRRQRGILLAEALRPLSMPHVGPTDSDGRSE